MSDVSLVVRSLRLSRFLVASLSLFAGLVAGAISVSASGSVVAELESQPITARHRGITREIAAGTPKREDDQVIVDGWPMYRTERGQEAFNHAMATLHATAGTPAPPAEAFAGCAKLMCPLALPRLTRRGWIPAGRLWVSPNQYILVVHSPRRSKYDPGKRRSPRSMRYFVFHEFHNSTGNTDMYDTISAHRSSVFVPFYLSKPGRDAQGRRYVTVVQVSPHDIVSRHARVFGSRGPGIEVAKNLNERLDPLQAKAGILVATIVKRTVPRLRVVRHRGREGVPMLRAYQRRLAALKRRRGARRLKLPFVAANNRAVQRAQAGLNRLIVHRGPLRQRPLLDAPTLRPPIMVAASSPRLVSAPRLIHALRQPIATMDALVARVIGQAQIVPPAPRLACRHGPGFVCRQE